MCSVRSNVSRVGFDAVERRLAALDDAAVVSGMDSVEV